jgi:hypothetical protein
VSTTDGRQKSAAFHDKADGTGAVDDGRPRVAHTPVYLIVSPRPQAGKTFLARLLIDFLQLDGGALAFDLNPGTAGLAGLRPAMTASADIATTLGQTALFDRLIANDGIPKVVDVGHGSFERFFEGFKGFVTEAARHRVEPVVMYAADTHIMSFEGYARLRGHFFSTVVVPVFNEAIAQRHTLREMFPVSRAASAPLQIPRLAPALMAHAEKPAHTFSDFQGALPLDLPSGQAYELRAWTKRTFLEFRELELRLLLEKLRASLERPL